MLDLVGWIGSVFLTFCGAPQAFKAWRTRSVADVSFWFVLMWFLGEVFLGAYVVVDNIQTDNYQEQLWLNYALNFFISGYLLFLKFHAAVQRRRTTVRD